MNIDLRLTKFATFSSQAWFETLTELHVGGHVIPVGLKTDGATQPRWTIAAALLLVLLGGFSDGIAAGIALIFGVFVIAVAYLVPAFGSYTLVAFLHDHLLTIMDRDQADKTMKKVMSETGVNQLWARIMYRLVRINSQIKNRIMGQ